MSINARVQTSFPGRITGSVGLKTVSSGGIVDIQLDPDQFPVSPNPLADTQTLLVIDRVTGDIAKTSADALLGSYVDAAEAAADLAQQYTSDAVSQGNVPIYSTASAISGYSIAPGINFFRTNGRTAIGDAGNADFMLTSLPTLTALFGGSINDFQNTIWLTSDAGTKYWLIVGSKLRIEQVGDLGLAIRAALALNVTLDLGRNAFTVPTKFDVASNGTLRIEGTGAVINFASGVSGSYAARIGGIYTVGPYNETYNLGNGTTTTVEHPSTFISADVNAGSDVITVDNPDGITPGKLLRIRPQRLGPAKSENRNSTCMGELVKVRSVSGNNVTLETKTYFGYKAGNISSGTLTAGGANSGKLNTGVDANLAAGCRLTITAGTGAGQSRYVNTYDATSGDYTIDTSSSYAQAPFSPAPNNASSYTLDAKAFITVIDPLKLTIEGDVTFNSVGRTVYNNIDLSGLDQPRLTNVKFQGGNKGALYLNNCYEALVENPISEDCGEDNGHSILSFESTRTVIRGARSKRTRRGGGDSGGSIMDCGLRVDGFYVVCTTTDTNGVAFDSNNPSFGIGTHGNSYDAVFENGSIKDAVFPFISRGVKTVFKNITIEGEFRALLSSSISDDIQLIGITARPLPGENVSPAAASTPALFGNRRVAELGTSTGFPGKIRMRDLDVEGLTTSPILFNGTRSYDDQVDIQDCRFVIITSAAVGIVSIGSTTSYMHRSIVKNNKVVLIGSGSWVEVLNWGAGDGTTPTWNQVGEKEYIAYIPDDKFLTIPNPVRQNSYGAKVFREIAGTAIAIGGRFATSSNAVAITSYFTAASASQQVPPFTGTTNTDGSFYIGHDTKLFWIENRSGSAQTMRVMFD